MIILKLLIVFAVIFSASNVGSKIVEALPTSPQENFKSIVDEQIFD